MRVGVNAQWRHAPVHVRVQVHPTRRYYQPTRIYYCAAYAVLDEIVSDCADTRSGDANVGDRVEVLCRINDAAAANDQVKHVSRIDPRAVVQKCSVLAQP